MVKVIKIFLFFISISLLANPEETARLWLAIANYQVEDTIEHIANGAEVNGQEDFWSIDIHNKKYRLTQAIPLHLAVIDDPKITDILLSNAANVNAKDINGNTPLHLAAMYGCRRVILSLIKSDAQVDIKNLNGQTPLSLAILHDHYKAAKILLLNGANLNLILDGQLDYLTKTLSNKDKYKFIKLLVDFGANINKRYSHNRTILHIAALFNRHESTRYLLNNCIDINALDNDDNTALHIAALKNNYKVIQVLLSCSNINIEIKNKLKKTALSLACSKNNKEAIEILLKYKYFTKILSQDLNSSRSSISNFPKEIARHITSYLPEIKKEL